MPQFNYKAKDETGREVSAHIDATSRYEALNALRTRGLTVLDLWMDDNRITAQPLLRSTPKTRRRHARVAATELTVFMRQLAISVNAGVPLREALESIAEDLDNLGFRRVISDVVAQLREGHTFSESTASYPMVFPVLFVALLRVAEEAGSMPQTLEYLATALERSERLSRKIRSIMAYPAFVAGFMVIISSVMTLFVVPRFQAIFKNSPTRLPLLTEVVFGVNRFLLENIIYITIGMAVLTIMFVLYARTTAGRRQLDAIALRLPLFGVCLKKLSVARFCRNFAIMIRGGVPVVTAMEIASTLGGNLIIKEGLQRARQCILRGSAIAPALATEAAFPRLLIRMVSIGETTGHLPEVMDKVSDAYEEQVESSIVMATALFEPIIICVFGGVVLVLVLAVYMPVFTAASRM